MTSPGAAGSPSRPAPDWLARDNRRLRQENEQLRGQLSKAKLRANGMVANVTVTGSTLKVTFGNGSSTTYQLP